MVISLYFHIPFCQKKCPYCHFFVIPNCTDDRKAFQEALIKEWRLRFPLIEGKKVASLYFGGGTPALHPEAIKAVLEQMALTPDMEVTVEANPEQITPELVSDLKSMGVNRMSVGIQSLDDTLLKVLGRNHTAQMAVDAVHTIYDAGIKNITVDLMNELPYQTLESWAQTLDQVTSLPIIHLSLYNLTFEKNTVFTKKKNLLRPHLPTDETCLEMLQMAVQKLEDMGLKRYEISAFAKKGYEAVHNSGYWTGRPFLGFGPSAFSYWEGKRFRNVCHLKRYAEKLDLGMLPVDFEEELPYPANMHEKLVIELRLCRGIDLQTFPLPETAAVSIEELIAEGFLQKTSRRLSLTEKGRLFYDSVAERLIVLYTDPKK